MFKKTLITLLVAWAACATAGCSKDPQVWVTPFVLKPAQPASQAPADVSGGPAPATNAYEAALHSR